MSTVWLVAVREVRTRLLAKATIVSTAIILVLVVAALVAAAIFTRSGPPDATQVGIAPETEDIVPALTAIAQQSGQAIETTVLEPDAGEAGVADGDLRAYLSGPAVAPEVVFDSGPDESLLPLVTEAARQVVIAEAITDLGGDPAQVGAQVAASTPTVRLLDADAQFDPFAFIVAMVTSALLLFTLLQCGSLIAMGVVEEKVSRVVEILLATIRPAQLMGGKVLGIGIVGLTQLLVIGGVAVVGATVVGLLDGVSLNLGWALAWTVLWFLLGFALYAVLFGGFAALVSRQEDIGAVTTPMVFGMMVPFYLGIYLVPNATDEPVTRILSQIPFFAPFMMPVRQAFGAVTGWELALSVTLCLLLVPALVWLAGRVYSRAVLNTGGRMRLKEALG